METVTRRESLMVLGALPLAAQSPAEKGKAIVEEALAAMGGAAFLAMADRVETGRAYSFYREELAGLSRARIFSRYLTRPEPPQPDFIGLRERQVLGKSDDYYILFTETGGMEVTYRGAKPMPEFQVERWKESLLHNILYTLRMRMGEPGLGFEFRSTEVFENVPVNVVDVIDSSNRVTEVYFQQGSKLPVRQKWTRRDPKTREKLEEITVFARYRDCGGGVQWPWVIRRERNGEKIFEMFSESVVINQGLTDDLFTLGADVKILDKNQKKRK
jgi:hypothetical protein